MCGDEELFRDTRCAQCESEAKSVRDRVLHSLDEIIHSCDHDECEVSYPVRKIMDARSTISDTLLTKRPAKPH